MKLFVESWEPVLRHRNGQESRGTVAQIVSKGKLEPYANGRSTLYIHHLDVEPVQEADLQPHTNSTTGKTSKDRMSPRGVSWWLCRHPKAFVLVDVGSGETRQLATIRQLSSPSTLDELPSGSSPIGGAPPAPTLPPEVGLSDSEPEGPFIPSEGDHRSTTLRLIKERRGQQSFRDALRDRYGDVCLITGCALLDVLEAAHIKPYRGEQDHNPANGLLLRADVHTLFDLNLFAIEPASLTVRVSPRLKGSDYAALEGVVLRCRDARPDSEALRLRWRAFLGSEK
jgi:hypothetical protein